MMGGRVVLIRAVDSNFPLTNPPDVSLSISGGDEHLVRAIERDSEVSAATGRRSVSISYRVDGGAWTNLTLYAYEDPATITVGKPSLLDGTKWPQRGQIVVERGSLAFSGLTQGAVIELDTSGSHKHPKLTVSGTIHDLNVLVPMMSGRAVGYVSWDTLQDLEAPQVFNDIEVRGAGHLSTLAQTTALGAHLRDDVIEPQGVTVLRMAAHEPGVQNIADIFKGVSMLLVLVGVMTLLLSGFLVINTIGALVSQQTRQLGVMKAIGAKSSQLVGMFFVMVIAYGLIALLFALPAGQLGSNWFSDYGAGKLDFLVTDYSAPGSILGFELAVGLLVPLLAATVPIVLGMLMPVRHALYGTGASGEFGEGLIDKALGRLRGLPRPVALALRNTFLRKGRLALTLAALTLAAGVFMAVATVKTSIDETVAKFGQHRVMDVWADLYPPQPATEAEAEVKRVPGVTGAEGWLLRPSVRVLPDRSESGLLFIYGLPTDTKYLHPEIVSGRWLKDSDTDAIVVDDSFLKHNPDVTVGSTIVLKIRTIKQAFQVVGISRGDLLNEFGYTSRTYLDGVLNAHGAIDTLMVGTSEHDADFQTAIAAKISDDFSARQMNVTDTMTQTQLQKTIRDSLNILVVFLGIMAGLLAAVGGIGLSGTMSINVLESTREIGVMRAVGAANGSIYQIFITEGIVVGLVSWAFGIVVSVPISYLLIDSLGAAMSFPLSYAYSPLGVGAWFVFVVVISVLASLLPAYRAARVSVAEAIAYE